MTKPSYESARLELARLRIDSRDAYEQAVVRTTELSARTLGVERVGVWLFVDGDARLRLEHLYIASTQTHCDGEILAMASAPQYREALHAKKAIVADDARTDPVTAGLTETYLAPLGITSMLDAPLYVDGDVAGVICHEHVGPRRTWTRAEVDFACTIADTAALICEQARRLRAERELRERVAAASASESVEAVTVLARSLGHELANVFAATRLGTSQLAKLEEPSSRALATALGEALGVGERLAADLRRFGDRASSQPPALRSPASDVLVRFAPVLELLTRGHARLVLDVAPSLTIPLDDTVVEQIVLNLVLNARDALASVGRTGEVRIEARRDGDETVLAVADDGPGIAPDLQRRVGHDYFTTKPHGTGLGLVVARRLAESAHGRLVVCDVSRGARIELRLPCA